MLNTNIIKIGDIIHKHYYCGFNDEYVKVVDIVIISGRSTAKCVTLYDTMDGVDMHTIGHVSHYDLDYIYERLRTNWKIL